MSARCMKTPLNANAAAGHTMRTRASETIGHRGMYNGNISWMETSITPFGKQAMLYKYAQLNRITKSRSLAFGNNAYAARSGYQKYDEDYSYNADGGLTSLQRRDETAQLKNDFAYSYYANTHRIQKLSAAGGTYEYDAIGNLIKNNREGTTITWTPSGKVRTVTKADTVTTYRYDAAGNRIAEITKNGASPIDTTHYVLDAAGNIMAVYRNKKIEEQPIYGSARIGEYAGKEKEGYQTFNLRKYELTNHLGNVLAVISDKVNLYGHNNILDSARATVMSASDYYPFGLPMKGRQFNEKNYRYGFNGMENDNEVNGEGNHLDYGARGRKRRLGGGWWYIDSLASKYPGISPYAFCFNNPNIYVDKDGRDAILIVFPDYKIDPELKVGKWKAPKVGGLGHAGVLLIDNKTGVTKYYEYGRYQTTDGAKGSVRNITVSNVVIGEDGKPTQESLNKVLGQISQKSGQRGKIEGAYVISDQFKAMNSYAQDKLNESNPGNPDYDKNRPPYALSENNCGTFAADCINQDPTVDRPSISNPTPTNIVDEYQEEGNARVTYDPKTKKSTIGNGDESDAKVEPKKK